MYANQNDSDSKSQNESRKKAASLADLLTLVRSYPKPNSHNLNSAGDSRGTFGGKTAADMLKKVEMPSSDSPTYAGQQEIETKTEPETSGSILGDEKTENDVNPVLQKLSVVLSKPLAQMLENRKALQEARPPQNLPQNPGIRRYAVPSPYNPPPMGAAPAPAQAQPQPAQPQGQPQPVGGGSNPMANPIQAFGAISASGNINGNAAFGVKNSPGSSKSAGLYGHFIHAEGLTPVQRKYLQQKAQEVAKFRQDVYNGMMQQNPEYAVHAGGSTNFRDDVLEQFLEKYPKANVWGGGAYAFNKTGPRRFLGLLPGKNMPAGEGYALLMSHYPAGTDMDAKPDPATYKPDFDVATDFYGDVDTGVHESLRDMTGGRYALPVAAPIAKKTAASSPAWQRSKACSCGCGDTTTTCKCGPSCSCRKPGGSCYAGEKKAVDVERGGVLSRALASTVGHVGGALAGLPILGLRSHVNPTQWKGESGSIFDKNIAADDTRGQKHLAIAKDMERVNPRALKDTRVYLGGPNLLSEYVRMYRNPRTSLPMKALGTLSLPLTAAVANLHRSSMYSPLTNSVYMMGDKPSVLTHELGHALDFNSRPLAKTWLGRQGRGLMHDAYALSRAVPTLGGPAALLQEERANTLSRINLEKAYKNDPDKLNEIMDERQRILPAGYGSYIGNAIGGNTPLAGPAALAGMIGGKAYGLGTSLARKGTYADAAKADDGEQTNAPAEDKPDTVKMPQKNRDEDDKNDKEKSEDTADKADKKPAETRKAASTPAWQRSEGQNSEGGLNAKGRASYNKATGGNLKAPVTEKNPKGKRATRQNSFCARMCGMKKHETGSATKRDPDSRINKSLSKWNCKCSAYEFGEKMSALIKQSDGTSAIGGAIGGGLLGAAGGAGIGSLYGLASGAYEAPWGKKLRGAVRGLGRGFLGGGTIGTGIGMGAGLGAGLSLPNGAARYFVHGPLSSPAAASAAAKMNWDPEGTASKALLSALAGGGVGGFLGNLDRRNDEAKSEKKRLARQQAEKEQGENKAAAYKGISEFSGMPGPDQISHAVSQLGMLKALVRPDDSVLKQRGISRAGFQSGLKDIYRGSKGKDRFELSAMAPKPGLHAALGGLGGLGAAGLLGYAGVRDPAVLAGTTAIPAIGAYFHARNKRHNLLNTAKLVKDYGLLRPKLLQQAYPLLAAD
jgi:hypothetical protein